jgi:hypothetical protein
VVLGKIVSLDIKILALQAVKSLYLLWSPPREIIWWAREESRVKRGKIPFDNSSRGQNVRPGGEGRGRPVLGQGLKYSFAMC